MQNKWEAIRGSVGFYVTLAVCLLVAGISGYFLLVERKEPAAKAEEYPAESPTEAAAFDENISFVSLGVSA